MLIGIELKRKKVFLVEENRSVWFWRVAPYVRDVDSTKIGAFIFIIFAMSVIFLIGENMK